MEGHKGMQRLKRGDMSRLHPDRAKHTDVYQPAPVQQAPQTTEQSPEVAALQQEVQKQRDRINELQTGQSDLSADNEALKAQLTDARKEAQELKQALKEVPEPAAPAQGIEVIRVANARKKDKLIRLDCQTKPTKGPVGTELALYLPADKLMDLLTEPPAKESKKNEKKKPK